MKAPVISGEQHMPDFDTALDTAIAQLRSGASLDECLSTSPEHAGQLRPLLELAALTYELAPVRAPGDAKARARARVWAAMEAKQRRPWWDLSSVFSQRLQPAALAAVSSAFLLFGSGSAMVASAGALPGDALYPVKLAVEEARLVTVAAQGDEASEALLRNELAHRRVEEAQTLAQQGRAVPPGLIEAAAQHERAADAAASQAPEPKRGQVVSSIVRDTQHREEVLQSLLRTQSVPPPAQTAIAQVLDAKAKQDDKENRPADVSSGRGRAVQPEARETRGRGGQADPTNPIATPEERGQNEERGRDRGQDEERGRNDIRDQDRSAGQRETPADENVSPGGQGRSSRAPGLSGGAADGRELAAEQGVSGSPPGQAQGRREEARTLSDEPATARGQGSESRGNESQRNRGNGNQGNRGNANPASSGRDDQTRGNGSQRSQGQEDEARGNADQSNQGRGRGNDSGRETQTERSR